MQAVVDVGVLQVDGDLAWYGVRRTQQLDLAPDDVEHAAALETARDGLVGEHHRHGDGDYGAAAHAHKVDVQRLVGDRVQLHLAWQDADCLPVHLEIAERAEEAGTMQSAPELAGLERHQRLRRLVAVQHARDAPRSSQGAVGALADALTRLSRQTRQFRHLRFLNTMAAAPRPSRTGSTPNSHR